MRGTLRSPAAALAATGAAIATVLPVSPPAWAGPHDSTPAILAVARLWAPTRTGTSATICAEGWVDDGTPVAGEWTFRVVGPTSTFLDPHTGASYPRTCTTLTTTGAPAGTTDASIAYVGAGGDVVADCTATASWAPGVPLTWVAACLTDPSTAAVIR